MNKFVLTFPEPVGQVTIEEDYESTKELVESYFVGRRNWYRHEEHGRLLLDNVLHVQMVSNIPNETADGGLDE